MQRLYPVIMTQNLASLQAFLIDYFGFEETFVSDWYISLRLKNHEIEPSDSFKEYFQEGFYHE